MHYFIMLLSIYKKFTKIINIKTYFFARIITINMSYAIFPHMTYFIKLANLIDLRKLSGVNPTEMQGLQGERQASYQKAERKPESCKERRIS